MSTEDPNLTAAYTRRKEECTDEVQNFLNDVAKGEFDPTNVIVVCTDRKGNVVYYRPATELLNTVGMLETAKTMILAQALAGGSVG